MKNGLVCLVFLVTYEDILRPEVGVVAQVVGEIALLPGGDRPVGHIEARKCYVAGLVLTDHALGEAFDLVF